MSDAFSGVQAGQEIVLQGHIDVAGHAYILRAKRTAAGNGWIARVGKYAAQAGAAAPRRQIRDEVGPFGTLAEISGGMTAEGATEEEARNRLDDEIRRVVTEATRVG